MTVQVAGYNFSSIGRMFARQNVSAVYGRQKNAGVAETDAGDQAVDRVELSSAAPKPLSGDMFSGAMAAARIMSAGGGLSPDQIGEMREDRIFSAISALATLSGVDSAEELPRSWPAGLPAPTREEMREARRRLAQRLQGGGAEEDSSGLQRERMELFEKIRNSDFSAFASAGYPAGAKE